MKKCRRVVALIVGALMCLLLLAACNPEQSAGSGSPGTGTAAPPPDARLSEEIDIIVNDPISVLHPFNPAAQAAAVRWVYNLIFDQLVTDLGEGKFAPELATQWETADYQTITMTLRDDVYFHNGDKFTAQDVYYTVLASRDGPGSTGFEAWRSVDTVTVIDPTTIQFVLHNVNVDFLHAISLPAAGILNQRAMTESPELGSMIGTGAFYVTEFVSNDVARFTRNDNWWGDEPPITQRLVLRFVPEIGARTIMIQNSESQVCFAISSEDMHLFEKEPNRFSIFPYVLGSPNTISFNMTDPITGDRNFRMAVIHAINREEIALAAMGDLALAETEGTVYGYATEFRDRDIPPYPYDLNKAKAYLAASSYNGETVAITAAQSMNIRAAEFAQQQLARIGINIEVNRVDSPSLSAMSRYADNRTQMTMHISTKSLSASSYRNWIQAGAALNRASYNNPAVNEMLDRAGTIIDVNERAELYKEIQRIVVEDSPWFTMFYQVIGLVTVKGVGGMELRTDHNNDLRWIYWVLD